MDTEMDGLEKVFNRYFLSQTANMLDLHIPQWLLLPM